MDYVLTTCGLSKHYGHFKALDGLTMQVPRGAIYGFVGKNGAGKTTLIRVVCGLQTPTAGAYTLYGVDSRNDNITKSRRRMGAVVETPSIYQDMTAVDNLKQQYRVLGLPSDEGIPELLALVGLENTGKKKAKHFSLGMKQRLGIALAVMNNPDLVILDEPINGLDPIGISELRDTFKKLSHEKNVTLIISSHILSELYMVANRFLFIEKGRVLKEITKEELDIECMRCHVVKTVDTKRAAALIEQKLNITNYKVIDGGELRIYDESVKTDELNRMLIQNDVNVSGIYETGISLEDYFKSLVGEVQS